MAIKKKTPQPKKKTAAEALREKKLSSYRDQIKRHEEIIREMDESRSALAKTGIEGLYVSHESFGNGTVIEKKDSIITVNFDFGNKRFVMPFAFIDGFLRTEDEEINGKLSRYKEMGEQIKAAEKDIKAAHRSIQLLAKK